MIKMVLLLAAMSGSALPRAATEAAPVPATSESSASRERELRRHNKRQKEKTGPRHWSDDERQDGPYVPVNEEGQLCLPSPLWERKVDPANYEFGCREIEVCVCRLMLAFGFVTRSRLFCFSVRQSTD